MGQPEVGGRRLGAPNFEVVDRPPDWDPPSGTPPTQLLEMAAGLVQADLAASGFLDVRFATSLEQIPVTGQGPLGMSEWLVEVPPTEARAWVVADGVQGANGVVIYDYEDITSATLRVADIVGDFVADEYREAWPACPGCRARHPLTALERDSIATWVCATSGIEIVIGELPGDLG